MARPRKPACGLNGCTDGVKKCTVCRGHGVLRASGKPYWKARNIQPTAIPCPGCKTGTVKCGCRPLNAEERVRINGSRRTMPSPSINEGETVATESAAPPKATRKRSSKRELVGASTG